MRCGVSKVQVARNGGDMRPYEARWFDETGITLYNYDHPHEFVVMQQDGSLTLMFKHANVRIWLAGEGDDVRAHVSVDR